MKNGTNFRGGDPEPSGSGGTVFYLSLSLLIIIVGYAMIILPQRG